MDDLQQNTHLKKPPGQFKKERRKLTDLPLADQKTFRAIERILWPIIEARRNNKEQQKAHHTGRGKLKAAREEIATLLEVDINNVPDRTIQS